METISDLLSNICKGVWVQTDCRQITLQPQTVGRAESRPTEMSGKRSVGCRSGRGLSEWGVCCREQEQPWVVGNGLPEAGAAADCRDWERLRVFGSRSGYGLSGAGAGCQNQERPRMFRSGAATGCLKGSGWGLSELEAAAGCWKRERLWAVG